MPTISSIATQMRTAIEQLGSTHPLLIAIDGRCGSGKTTLAHALQQQLGCNVFAMDHFFLRPEQRSPERLSQPGGNVDRERFMAELLPALKQASPVSYRPFDCQQQTMGEHIHCQPTAISIIEGSYSCHPELREHYDLRFFITVNPVEQRQRIIERNGEQGARLFQERWIPLEEAYFSAFDVANACDIRLDTSHAEA